jgi:uncharacterized protein YegP (UPF0339 family)
MMATHEQSVRVEGYLDHAGEYRWRAVAANGRIVSASSEGYARRWDCETNAQRVTGMTPSFDHTEEHA